MPRQLFKWKLPCHWPKGLLQHHIPAPILQFPPMLSLIPCLPQSIMPCLYSCISYPLWVINARAQPASLPHSSSNRYCYYWWGMHILTTGSRYCYWMRGICTYWPIISHWGGWEYYRTQQEMWSYSPTVENLQSFDVFCIACPHKYCPSR